MQQAKILANLDDRTYFISEIILAKFGNLNKMYKIMNDININLGKLREKLDITIIDYFPDCSDYSGNIRCLFMFIGNKPKNIDHYKKDIFTKDC